MATRAQVLRLLGEPPAPVPLDPAVRSQTPFPGGTRLLIDYTLREGERAPAYLLIPNAPRSPAGRYPAILAVHRDAGRHCLGKSEPAGLSANPMYHYGLELCRRGYAVLCPDLLGYEDRQPPEYQRAEGMAPEGEAYERYVAMQLLLQGSSLRARYTFDLARGLDLLQSLEFVDGDRLGVIGHALGGQEAFWLTWYDARVRAGVSSCGLSTLQAILREQLVHNLALYLPGLLRVADVDAVAAELAPCPFMLAAAEEDHLYPIDGVRQITAACQTAYMRAGVPDQFRALLFPGVHGFPPTVREEAYRFVDRWVRT